MALPKRIVASALLASVYVLQCCYDIAQLQASLFVLFLKICLDPNNRISNEVYPLINIVFMGS